MTQLLTYRDRQGVRVNLATLVTSRLLLTANSGGGKSHAIRQLLEDTHGEIQQIVIDREGEFATLREKFPYLLVGPGGEAAADLRSAPLLARKLLELGVSAVIDLSELDLRTQRQYVAAFADAISHAPRELWHDALIVIDEAYLFAPQKLKKGEGAAAASLAALSLAASTWRKRGYCMVLATTRVSKLDKDISGEMLNKLIGRTSEEDRKRAAEELGIDANTAREMRAFKEGTFWAYGPAIADAPVLVHTEKHLKTHPPKRGAAREPVPPTPAAIRAIADALAELPKEAAEEARTVADLQKRNAELQRQLTKLARTAADTTKEIPVVDERAVQRAVDRAVKEGERRIAGAEDEFHRLARPLAKQADALTAIADGIRKNIAWSTERFQNAVGGKTADGTVTVGQVVHHERPERDKGDGSVRSARPSRSTGPAHLSGGDTTLGKGERIVLIATAQHTDGVTREQLTVLTGYRRSTRDAYIQRLQQRELVALEGDKITATDAGLDAIGPDFTPLPTGDDLREYWLREGQLPKGERDILALLCGLYPDPVDRAVISDETGFARSSRDAYLQRLSARKLVVAKGGGVAASPILFD